MIRPGTIDFDLSRGHLDVRQPTRQTDVMVWHHAFSPSRRVGFRMLCLLAVVPAELAIGNSSDDLEEFRQIFGAVVES